LADALGFPLAPLRFLPRPPSARCSAGAAAALRDGAQPAGKLPHQTLRKALPVVFPAALALPALPQQQARQALRAIQFTEALAAALEVAATTQQLTAGRAALVDKVAAAAAVAG
jgi:hypothetical protein